MTTTQQNTVNSNETTGFTYSDASLMGIASKDQTRYSLGFVEVDKKNNTIKATDGRVALVKEKEIRGAMPGDSRDEGKICIKLPKIAKRELREVADFSNPGYGFEIDKEIFFPDVDRVIPQKNNMKSEVTWAVDVLEKLCKVAKAHGESGITFGFSEDGYYQGGSQYLAASRIEIGSGITGAIMPIRKAE